MMLKIRSVVQTSWVCGFCVMPFIAPTSYFTPALFCSRAWTSVLCGCKAEIPCTQQDKCLQLVLLETLPLNNYVGLCLDAVIWILSELETEILNNMYVGQ